jgi:peptidoglycan/xylan/chitin deacetylase (PgdA/CDA1 family)
MRQVVKGTIIHFIPFAAARMMSGVRLLIAYYHVVSDVPVQHLAHLYAHKGVKQFEEDLEFLLKHYRPIDLKELLCALQTGREFKTDSFLLTFDDGFREIHDVVAPVLSRKGIPAVFFLCPAFIDNRALCFEHKASLLAGAVEHGLQESQASDLVGLFPGGELSAQGLIPAILRLGYTQTDVLDRAADIAGVSFDDYLFDRKPYLTSAMVNDLLKRGFHVGAHSIDHPRYAALSHEESLYQTVESVRQIRECFALDYGVFAFPHSDANISMKLLADIYQSRLVDVTFGNQGVIAEPFPKHLQRFSLEKPIRSAREIIVYNYLRKIYRNMTGRGVIIRP